MKLSLLNYLPVILRNSFFFNCGVFCFILFCFFKFLSHALWHARSWFPDQEFYLYPLQWKLKVLTNGLLEKSLRNSFKYLKSEKKASQRRNFCFASWLVNEIQLLLGISPSSELPVLTECPGSQDPQLCNSPGPTDRDKPGLQTFVTPPAGLHTRLNVSVCVPLQRTRISKVVSSNSSVCVRSH